MPKKLLTAILCCLLLAANASIVSAQKTDDSSRTAKIKVAVIERGTGEKKRVTVKMLNGTKLKGYISQAGDDSFTLKDPKTNQSTTINYSDVGKVENRSTRGDKITFGIVVGAAAAVAVIVISFFAIRQRNE